MLRSAALYPEVRSVPESRTTRRPRSRASKPRSANSRSLHSSHASVPLETFGGSVLEFWFKKIPDRYPPIVLRSLKPVTVRVLDLGTAVRLSVPARTLETVDERQPDLEVRSQPLSFVFLNTFGFQTHGVLARCTIFQNASNWRKHRILFSLHNAELYLRPSLLFGGQNLAWFASG